MNTVVERKKYKGLTIVVFHDTGAPDPRREGDNLGTMACWHNKYTLLGDKHTWSSPDELRLWAKRSRAVILNLYLGDHSGITMRTSPFSCPWDSCHIGYIYATRKRLRQEMAYTGPWTQEFEDKCLKLLDEEVKTYDLYLTGQCYGYEIRYKGTRLDSSRWGLLGLDYCTEEAEQAADYCHQQQIEEARKDMESKADYRGH